MVCSYERVFDLFATITLTTTAYESGLNAARNATDNFGTASNKVLNAVKAAGAAALTATSAAAIKFGKDAITAGMNFDSAMSKVSAISGATGKDFDALRNKAQEMGAKTKFSATESANAFEYMAMAGWKTEDMLNGIDGVMSLAAASGEDLATTSDIVTDALTAFGLSAKDSSHFADVLAATATSANTNVSMMGETFKYAAPIVGALYKNGGDAAKGMEDAAAAIGLMANSGVKASEAGTSLRSILTRLSTNAGASSKSLGALDVMTEKLGVQFYNTDGTVRDLDAILSESREAWSGLSAEQQTSYAKTIAGQNAMSGWLAIMNAASSDVEKVGSAIKNASYNVGDISNALSKSGIAWEKYADKAWNTVGDGIEGLTDQIIYDINEIGLSTEELQEFLMFEYELDADDALKAIESVRGSLESATGAAEKMAGVTEDNLAGDITFFKSALEGAQIALNDKLTPSLRDFVQTATSGMSDFTTAFKSGNIDGAFKQIGETVGKLADKIVQSIPAVAKAAVRIVAGIASGISKELPQIISSGLSIIKSLSDGIKNNLPKLIPAAMESILKFSEFLRSNIGEIVDAGIDLIVNLANGLIDGIPTFIETVPTIISNLAGIINDNAPKILKAGVGLIVNLVKGLISAIPTLVKEAPKIVKAIVDVWTAFNWAAIGKNAINLIKDGITALKDTLPGALKEIGTNALNFFKNVDWAGLGQSVISLIYKGITTVIDKLPEVLKSIGKTAALAFQQVDWADVGKKVITFIANAAKAVFKLVVDVLTYVGNKAFDAFKNIDWKSLGTNLINVLAKGISGALKTALNAAKNAATSIAETIGNKVKNTSFVTEGTKMLNTIVSKASETVSKAKNAASSITEKIKAKISATTFSSVGWTMLRSIFEKSSDAVSKARDVAANIGDRIKSVLSNFSLFDVGSNLISGLWNGISNKAQWLYNQISNMGSTIVSKVKSLFGVHSPSTVFAEIGGYLAEGLGVGWDNGIPKVIKEVEDSLAFDVNPLRVGASTSSAAALSVQDTIYQMLYRISSRLDEMNADIHDSVDASRNTQIILNGREVGRAVRSYA